MRLLLGLLLIVTLALGTVGTVKRLQGRAELHKADSTITVTEGLPVAERETMVTSERSKVLVALIDASLITIGPRSTFRFVAVESGENPRAMMEIRHGFFKAVTGQIGTVAPERFKIKTNEATIGVRGTSFMGHVEPGREAIGCEKGRIFIETAEGVYEIAAGEMMLFEQGIWRREPFSPRRFAPVRESFNGLEKLTDEILITIDEGLVDDALHERDKALESLEQPEAEIPPVEPEPEPVPEPPVDTPTDIPANHYNDYFTP